MMEPMLPEEAALQSLEDSALKLVESASGLAKRAHPMLQQSVGDLVRSMNCYYSNLIEGHFKRASADARNASKAIMAEASERVPELRLLVLSEMSVNLETSRAGNRFAARLAA